MTARKWIERYMGKDAYRALWGPLLRGKFGERADDVAMVWLQNKLRLRRGDDAADEKLGYPKHSWEKLLHALQERIEAGGGRVLIDRPVAKLSRRFHGHPGRARTASGAATTRARSTTIEPERYDAVLATLPSDVFEQVLEPGVLPEAYLARARSIEYFTALCLLIEIDRQFSPYYWTNIGDDALPFVGLIEHTNLIGPRALRRPPVPVRRQLPAARATSCSASTPTSCSSATRRACRRSIPRSTAPGSSSSGCTANRPRSRSSPSATARRSRP